MKTEKEKMQAGETYYAFDPELMKLHRDCLKWVEEYNRTYFRDYTQGGELLRKFLPNAHPSLVIQAPFWCDFGFNIYGGENGFINYTRLSTKHTILYPPSSHPSPDYSCHIQTALPAQSENSCRHMPPPHSPRRASSPPFPTSRKPSR